MAIRGYSWALGCSRSPLQHGTAQGKLSSPGQEFTSPKKEAELFQVSSLELVWQRCFFLNYTIMHMQCGHRSNCCPETLTLAFSYFPGLSPRCVCGGVLTYVKKHIQYFTVQGRQSHSRTEHTVFLLHTQVSMVLIVQRLLCDFYFILFY